MAPQNRWGSGSGCLAKGSILRLELIYHPRRVNVHPTSLVSPLPLHPYPTQWQPFRVKQHWYHNLPKSSLSYTTNAGAICPSLGVAGRWHAEIDTHLVAEDVIQRRPVAQIDPIALRLAPLLTMPFGHSHPVVAFGPRNRRRQPDLLVGWLLIDDVGALDGEANGENAGLVCCGGGQRGREGTSQPGEWPLDWQG